MPFKPRYYKADEAHSEAKDGEKTYRVLTGKQSGYHNLTAEEIVQFHKVKSGERRQALNTREMEMHEHWPLGSDNVALFMDFDKVIALPNADLKAELESNERAVANVMYTAYGAASGLSLDCLRAYNSTLEMYTFSEFDSNIVYTCECKQCATFTLPTVYLYKSHRRLSAATVKCSVHCIVRGERHCTNARHIVRAIVASISALQMQNVFIDEDEQNQKKFAFDWLPYSTRSLRLLGSTKGGDQTSAKKLSLVLKNGRACELKPADLEFNVTNLQHLLIQDKTSKSTAFEALKLHTSLDLQCEELIGLLARNGIQMPNLPSHQVLAINGCKVGMKRPSDSDISPVSAGLRPFTDETERSERESLCQKVKMCFRARNNLPHLKVDRFFWETTDPGLGADTTQASMTLRTNCTECPNRKGGGKHKHNCLHIKSVPYGIKNDTQAAPIWGWCFSPNRVQVGARDKMQAWLAPQTLHEHRSTQTSSKAQVNSASQAPQSTIKCIEYPQ